MNQLSRIYVAGHTGLVGSALVRHLTSHGYERLIIRSHDELDLRNQFLTDQFFAQERPEYVFLVAARVGGIRMNQDMGADFLFDNLQIATNVICSALKYGVVKLINFGSSCIYPHNLTRPIRETDLLTGPLEVTNEAYAIAKIAAVKLCRAMYRQYGKNFYSIMPPNLYGPNDNFNLYSAHVLPALIRKFHLGRLFQEQRYPELLADLRSTSRRSEPIRLRKKDEMESYLAKQGIYRDLVKVGGTGTPQREFLHVDDLADFAGTLMEQRQADEIGECINVGTGICISVSRLARLIAKVVSYAGRIEYDPSIPDGTRRKVMNSERAAQWGFRPQIRLKQGIESTYRWYLAQREEDQVS